MRNKILMLLCVLPISSTCLALTAEQQQAKLQQTERQVVQLQRTVKKVQAGIADMQQDAQQLTERQQTQQQAQQRQLQVLSEQIEAILAQQQQHSSQLQSQATQQAQLGQSLQQLDQQTVQTSQTTQALGQTLQHRSWWYAIATGLIALLLIIGYVYLNRRGQASTQSLTTQLEQTISQVRNAEEKTTQADTALADRLFEILTQLKVQQQSLSAVQPTAVATPVAVSLPAVPDHHLPLKLADEIHRMRKRLATLPEETKGLTPLKKSLERLENELLEQGYEIVDHLGMAYTENLSVKARFIPSDDLEPDQQLITKVVSPQVNYQGVLIRMADIEVSIG
ncbi:MAG: hypothetical protein WA154_13990 [Moraxellaceae bacterium]